jgi:hypothetical protein
VGQAVRQGEQGLLGLPSSWSVNCTERCCNVPLVPYRPLLSSQLPGQTLVLLPKCPARLPCLLLLCRQVQEVVKKIAFVRGRGRGARGAQQRQQAEEGEQEGEEQEEAGADGEGEAQAAPSRRCATASPALLPAAACCFKHQGT